MPPDEVRATSEKDSWPLCIWKSIEMPENHPARGMFTLTEALSPELVELCSPAGFSSVTKLALRSMLLLEERP